MHLLTIAILCAVVLLVAYRVYGSLLARLLRLNPDVQTPAVTLRDDVDYHPLAPGTLMSQHFSAIAAAGPIVGPILAGAMFGWVPALIWIIVGSIFVGGVHDITALTASVRHKARSIAEVVREHMSRRSYVLFLVFVWLALDYIVVAFADITASAFVKPIVLDDGRTILGTGIATSSLLYLLIPVAMGLVLRFTKVSLRVATPVFLVLVGVSIWLGQKLPLDLGATFGLDRAGTQKLWDMIILGYCLIASLVPMWCLLQPRGHLGGYFLLISLVGSVLGLLLGGEKAVYPAFIGWTSAQGAPLVPMLFITIACGACSGFHAIVASGTTAKQLRRETDAKAVGYGAMLLEAMVAFVALSCVMRLAPGSTHLKGLAEPDKLYAVGIGRFLEVVGIPAAFGVPFALMAFTTFVYDTLDVCTRLGRYIIEELTGWRSRAGRTFAALLTAGAPVPFLLLRPTDGAGNPVEVWRIFWQLFGASNQLLAALTLIGVTVWLWRTRRALWVFAVLGPPTVLMYVMSAWALVRLVKVNLSGAPSAQPVVGYVACVLAGLALMMLLDAVLVFSRRGRPPTGLAPVAA